MTPPNEGLIPTDLILLLVGAPGGEGPGRLSGITRLEKLVYLLTMETKVPNLVEEPFVFVPYNYGPYSKGIYEAIDLLKDLELVKENRVFQASAVDEYEEMLTDATDQEGVERRFSLTDRGKAVVAQLQKQHPDVAKSVGEIRQRYGALPLPQLIRYVYTTYPASAENSVIRDRHLPR